MREIVRRGPVTRAAKRNLSTRRAEKKWHQKAPEGQYRVNSRVTGGRIYSKEIDQKSVGG